LAKEDGELRPAIEKTGAFAGIEGKNDALSLIVGLESERDRESSAVSSDLYDALWFLLLDHVRPYRHGQTVL
jgi:hypothetical protein